MLGPIVGERSVLLLDEHEHLRHRRLMLPPFHGRSLQAYADSMQEATDLEIEAWPVGREFSLLESMQSLTLGVIVRAVFGCAGVARVRSELRVPARRRRRTDLRRDRPPTPGSRAGRAGRRLLRAAAG